MNRRQTIPAELRYTLNQFDREFPTDDACLEQIKEQRFPGGVTVCEKCEEAAQTLPRNGTHRLRLRPLAGIISTHWQGRSSRSRALLVSGVVSGYVLDGIDPMRNQRETDSTRDGRNLQNRVENVQADSHRCIGEDMRLGGPGATGRGGRDVLRRTAQGRSGPNAAWR